MTITQKILYELATKGITPKPALLMLGPSRQTIWHKLKRSIDKGWVQEDTYVIGNHKHDFLSITVDGLVYLRDQCGDDIPWTPYLEIPKRIKIMGSGYSRTEIATTYSRSVMAAVMADLAGAQETVMTHHTNIDDPASLYHIVSAAMHEYDEDLRMSHENATLPQSRSDVEFVDGLSMKRMVEEHLGGDDQLYDIRAGRMAGMIHTAEQAFLLYVVTRDNWFSWDGKLLSKELLVFKEVLRHRYGETVSTDNLQGILLVDTVDTLVKVFSSRNDILAGRKPGRRFGTLLDFGSGLQSMSVILMTNIGAQTLRERIIADVEMEREVFLRSLIEPQVYDRNEGGAKDYFQLQDPFDTRYIVEPYFDIVRARKAKALMTRFDQWSYEVLCTRQDEPLFAAILPESPVHEYLPTNVGNSVGLEFAVEKEARLLGL